MTREEEIKFLRSERIRITKLLNSTEKELAIFVMQHVEDLALIQVQSVIRDKVDTIRVIHGEWRQTCIRLRDLSGEF